MLPKDFNASSFWRDTEKSNPPLTCEMVLEAQRQLGVELPSGLIDLLFLKNGGYTQGFGFPMEVETSWSNDHVPLEELNGIVLCKEDRSYHNLMDSLWIESEWSLPPKQIALCGDGHWYMTLDYRRGSTPEVFYMDTECEEETKVADDFDTFLAGLRPISSFEHED